MEEASLIVFGILIGDALWITKQTFVFRLVIAERYLSN